MKPIVIFLLAFAAVVQARIVDYHLTIDEISITHGGQTSTGMAINGSIPAPTLIFTEGDVARIHVHNSLNKESTSLHWHGLLLPNDQDGVPYLNTPLIAPGESFTYQFPLSHAGTFWYHSHQGLQEQRGLYGGIVVHPKKTSTPRVDREHVMVLSDFSHQNPNRIMRNLMRGSNYYSIRKGTMQSLWGAIRQDSLGDYWEREKTRMLPMDVSDIAYHAFWINGKSKQALAAKPGERIRLRVINAGASTYFYLNSALPKMTIISADGNEVKPLDTKRLLLGMGETYDLLVTMPPTGSYEVRATAQDVSGFASLWLGDGEEHRAPDVVRPNYYKMDFMLNQALDMEDPLHPHGSPYNQLQSVRKTSFPQALRTREIALHLTGDMQRYRWSFNNKTLFEESTIPVKRGEVLRFKLINDSMMHHPIHLHGHFFRMLNDAGDYSPLKHTVDLPPMGSRTIEFYANEHGDWIFHCHLLYHMDAGMARVISYDDQGADHQPNLGPGAREPWYPMVYGIIQNNMTMGMASIMWGRENFSLEWEHSLKSESEDHHEENEIYWSHYFSPNWTSLAGYRFSPHDSEENHFFAGVRYRLPYFIFTEISFNNEEQARIELMKSLQLTDRLSAWARWQYDTEDREEYAAGLEYTINENYGITGGYDSRHGWGVGIGFQF